MIDEKYSREIRHAYAKSWFTDTPTNEVVIDEAKYHDHKNLSWHQLKNIITKGKLPIDQTKDWNRYLNDGRILAELMIPDETLRKKFVMVETMPRTEREILYVAHRMAGLDPKAAFEASAKRGTPAEFEARLGDSARCDTEAILVDEKLLAVMTRVAEVLTAKTSHPLNKHEYTLGTTIPLDDGLYINARGRMDVFRMEEIEIPIFLNTEKTSDIHIIDYKNTTRDILKTDMKWLTSHMQYNFQVAYYALLAEAKYNPEELSTAVCYVQHNPKTDTIEYYEHRLSEKYLDESMRVLKAYLKKLCETLSR